jgi:HEAT repeat protein
MSSRLIRLRKQLTSANKNHRSIAALNLANMKAAASSFVPDLLDILANDPEWTVRQSAATALFEIDPESKSVRKYLRLSLEDSSYGVRVVAALSLWKSCKHRDALPTLVECLAKADTPRMRQQAARAIEEFGPAATPAVPELARALRSSHWFLVSSAARALGAIGPGAKPAVKDLSELLVYCFSHSETGAKLVWRVYLNGSTNLE